MALTKEEKKKQIQEIEEGLSRQKSIVLVDFYKTPANELFLLRKLLRDSNCLMRVVKKTLAKIAFNKFQPSLGDEIEKYAPGQLALVFGLEDEIAPAKIVYSFAKEHENLKILGGVFENCFISKEKVIELATLPSKNELLSQLVLNLGSPLRGLVNTLQGNIKGLLNILTQIKQNN